MTPEQRVGKIANLMIFLGILYCVLYIMALLGNPGLASRSYGLPGSVVALGVIGVGYGIRYGSVPCLYAATGMFIGLTGYGFYNVAFQGTFSQAVRLACSGWALYGLCRALPAMYILKKTHAAPLRTSRSGQFFLHRWRNS